MKIVSGLVDGAQALVFTVSYIPIYIAWNLVGKPVSKALAQVQEKSLRDDLRMVAEQTQTREQMRELLLRYLYNSEYQKRLKEIRCARSV